jgi:hypothetical protein
MPGRTYVGREVVITALKVKFLAVAEYLLGTHAEMYHGTIQVMNGIRHLNAAQIILLFISPERIHEVSRAIERYASHEAIIIPVLLRPVAMLGEALCAHIQSFPRNGRPVFEAGSRKGSVFAEIANEISVVVKDFTRGG